MNCHCGKRAVISMAAPTSTGEWGHSERLCEFHFLMEVSQIPAYDNRIVTALLPRQADWVPAMAACPR